MQIEHRGRRFTLRQRGKKWELRIRVDGQQKSFYVESEAAAKDEIDRLFGRAGTLEWFYADIYLPTIEDLELQTIDSFRKALDLHFLPILGLVQIRDLDRDLIQRAVNQLRSEKEFAPSTLQLYTRRLSSVLNLAVHDGYIDKNPVKGVKIRGIRKIERRILSFAEIAEIESSPAPFGQLCTLLFSIGLTFSEAAALTRSDLVDGTLLVRGLNTPQEGPKDRLKNEYRRREIPLPKNLERRILEQAGQVFLVEPTGGAIRAKNLYDRTRDFLAPWEGVTTHTGRRTFISLMENHLECPRPIVEAITGHAGDGSSHSGYNHRAIERARGWLDKYDRQVLRKVALRLEGKKG